MLPTLKVPDNIVIIATENGWMTTTKVHYFVRHTATSCARCLQATNLFIFSTFVYVNVYWLPF